MNEQTTRISPVTTLIIDSERDGQRLDNFLFNNITGVPKSKIYKIIRKGEVRVNKKRADVSYKLITGDIVRIPPVRTPSANDLDKMDLYALRKLGRELIKTKLYEDEGLLIINKPASVAVHGGSGLSLSIIEALRLQDLPYAKNLELVHRLDKETSGCLMIAKKRSYLRELHAMLREGKVQKTYVAAVKGNVVKNNFSVDLPLIRRIVSGENMTCIATDGEGQQASTKFKLMKKYKDFCILEAQPITGRTHQIRVHALGVNNPILMDEKYGDKVLNKKFKQLGLNRLFLHAKSICLSHPKTKEKVFVEAPLTEDLSKFLNNLR
jgi:23S rRNA pseudouridine955/2504/2580 synthase